MNQIQAPENQSRVRRPRTWLRLGLVLIFLGAIGGGLLFFHRFKANILKQVVVQITSQLPTVATAKAGLQDWQPELTATGTLRASDGADLSSELGGIVGGRWSESPDGVEGFGLVEAEHRQGRNKHRSGEQKRRRLPVDMLDSQPEIQADTAVDPGDDQARGQDPDLMRRGNAVGKDHLRIELFMPKQALAESHA